MNRRDFLKLAGLGILGLLSPQIGEERLDGNMKTFVELMIDVVDGKQVKPAERELLRQEFARLKNLQSIGVESLSDAKFRSITTEVFNDEKLIKPIKLYRSTNQAIATGPDYIDFDTVVSAPSGFADLVTNPTRITIPRGMGGTYLVGFHVLWDAMNVAGGYYPACGAGIFLNGNISKIICDDNKYAATGFGMSLSAVVPYEFVEGDYIELFVEQQTGNTLNILTRTENRTPIMFMYKYL